MTRRSLLISLVLHSLAAFSQPGHTQGQKQVTLKLPAMIQTGKLEFSSIAWYGRDLLKHTNYTRLIRLTFNPVSSLNWKKVCDVDFTSANWEGIAAFRKGALIVTDEYPESVLKWITY